MATVYRHQGVGSPLQVMYFTADRIGELKRAIEAWELEHEMWEKVGQRPGDGVPAAARKHLGARQRKLSDAIDVARRELGTLQELYKAFQPCTACGGSGEYRVQYDQDDIRSYPCETCKGSGTRA